MPSRVTAWRTAGCWSTSMSAVACLANFVQGNIYMYHRKGREFGNVSTVHEIYSSSMVAMPHQWFATRYRWITKLEENLLVPFAAVVACRCIPRSRTRSSFACRNYGLTMFRAQDWLSRRVMLCSYRTTAALTPAFLRLCLLFRTLLLPFPALVWRIGHCIQLGAVLWKYPCRKVRGKPPNYCVMT